MDSTAKQIAVWIALGALFLIPLAPLVVTPLFVTSSGFGFPVNFFFPFISGKAFYLRILIEIAVAAWVVLALLDKAYRPRFSWIGAAIVAFVAWMFIADAFALNPLKAFWSNFERMEGWVMLIHLLGFFFAASAVLRVEKKWRAWFFVSLAVAAVISVYALFQLGGKLGIHQASTRLDATLGNSIYLAVYLLFTTFVAGWLALTERRRWLRWTLIVFAVIEAVLIFFTETRGAILGLVGALLLAALLTLFTAGARARRSAALALLLLLLLTGSFYLARGTSFVQENHVLQRIASISLADGKTRFTIWRMALKGVSERPLTGYGQEGFNYVFNKYYEPSLYGQEQWFDRAHNAFIDWLSAGGIPAFLLYLSLFGTAFVLLWRSSSLSRPERIALTAALAGYAIHNFFVFDNLYSYIYFFAILALIDSQVSRPIPRLEKARELDAAAGTTSALPIAAVILAAVIWWVNVPGMRVASGLIGALSPSPKGASGNIALFSDLAARPAFATQEVREQMVAFATMIAQGSVATDDEKRQALILAATEMQKQVAKYPKDARGRMQLSYVYRAGGDGTAALREVQTAITLSPRKQAFWLDAGMLAWDLGDTATAQKNFATAYELDPSFSELALYAAIGEIAIGNQGAADQILIQVYGTTKVDSDLLAIAYYRTKAWPQLIALMKARTEAEGASAEDWFALASTYYAAGDRAATMRTIKTLIAKFPAAAAAGNAALAQIQAGK